MSAARLAAIIQELVRAQAATAPLPRTLPYLGLDHPSGTGFHLLDALSTRGIFRKYELVLDLGAGLGATSRWLACRLGCEVVGTTASVAEATAAGELTRRAGLDTAVRHAAALPTALPFRDGRFTHVWILEALPSVRDAAVTLAEAFRVVRPGGTLAVQELVAGDASPPPIAGWRFARAAERAAAVERAGFVELQLRDVTRESGERSPRLQAARAQLLAQLDRESARNPGVAAAGAVRAALATALAQGSLGVIQLLARRPA